MKIVGGRRLNGPFLIFLMESFRLGFVSSDTLSSSVYARYSAMADLYKPTHFPVNIFVL